MWRAARRLPTSPAVRFHVPSCVTSRGFGLWNLSRTCLSSQHALHASNLAHTFSQSPVSTISTGDRKAQMSAVTEIERALFEGNHAVVGGLRATVVMPGGSGKTLVGRRAVQRALEQTDEEGGVSRVLVLVPRLALMEQTVRDYMSERNGSMLEDWSSQALCVCSSLDAPLRRTTDVDVVAQHLNRKDTDKLLVFSTYASVKTIQDAGAMVADPFTLVVFDEAHYTAGLGEGSGRALHNENIHAFRRLFLTATPRLLGTTRSPADDEDEVAIVRTMNDTSLFGPIVYWLNSSQAIEEGITVPVKLVLVEEYNELPDALSLLEPGLAQEMGLRALAVSDLASRYNLKKIISFSRTNARSLQLHEAAQELGRMNCLIVDGSMSASTREETLSKAHEDSSDGEENSDDRPFLISNSRLLIEGFDLPSCDGVFLADDMKSHVAIQQAMARAARSAPGKECGYLCIPLKREELLDKNSPAYLNVHNVLLAMAQGDESILIDIRSWQMRVGQGHESSLPKSLENLIVFPEGVDVEGLVEAMKTVVLNFGGSWDKNIGLLIRYREENGHCNVPSNFETKDGIKLGFWVGTQRQAHRKGSLSEEQTRRLSEVGFAWNTLDSAWELSFQRLEQYVEDHGDCLVPKSFETKEGVKLGTWVTRQRQVHRKGNMSEEQTRRLSEVGFVWNTLDSAWENSFQLLERYVEDHGDCLVPKSFETKDGNKLGDWVNNQRQRKGTLSEERTRRLSEVEFAWTPNESAWEDSFQRLEQYTKDHGDCSVPRSFETKDGNKLGGWVHWQRQAHRKGILSEEQTRRLSKVGFVWNTLDSAWELNFQRLEQYIKDHGDCLVPTSFETKDGNKLGDWVSNQRNRKGSLSEEQTQRLSEVGFVWNTFDCAWEDSFQRLMNYVEDHGDCLVPQSFETVDGSKLGLWVFNQRQRKGTLSEERLQLLNDVGFAWKPLESR